MAFKNHRKQSDSDPDWNLFLTEPSPQRQDRPPARDAERGGATGEAISERADNWIKQERDRHVRALVEKFEPDTEIPF